MSEHDDEPHHASSPTDQILTELQLYGYRPFADEPDPRPLPEDNHLAGAVTDIFDALIATFADTRLEPDLADLLWSTVNLFHRAIGRIERALDDNEQGQRRSQQEQDGSEVRSVDLERLTAEGQTLNERRDAFELMRDQAAEHYEQHSSAPWRPRTGSTVSHKAMTAAMIDSRDFLIARKRAEQEVLLPPGPKVAFTGGLGSNDHRLIWDSLDKVHAKHPDMVQMHGKSPRDAEKIASRWADHRKVPQIGFAPDWTKHGRAVQRASPRLRDRSLSVRAHRSCLCDGWIWPDDGCASIACATMAPSDFLPLGDHPTRHTARGPRIPHSSRTKKVAWLPSSGAATHPTLRTARPCGV